MMRAVHEIVSPQFLIPPAVYAADTTRLAVDLAGFGGALIALAIGAGGITFSGTNKIEFRLHHGDTDVVNDHVAVVQADVAGVTIAAGGIIRALEAAHAAASISELSYMGARRFISLQADFSGTHGVGTPVSAVVLRANPLVAPVA